MSKSALAIAAHPDDIEFLMAGTLLHLARSGYAIHYWNLANGCCGTTEYDAATIADLRAAEAQAAAQRLGATYHASICNDLEIFYDRPTLLRVASTLRGVAPDIVLTHAPQDYMEDHMNTCRLAVTAAFSRGMPNFPVDPPQPAIATTTTVYHAQPYSHRDMLGQTVFPQFFVDVSDVIEDKVDLLRCHATQKKWLDESQGLDSYLETLRTLDREAGEMSGAFTYAEGWRKHLHLGFCDAADDPLQDALRERCVPCP